MSCKECLKDICYKKKKKEGIFGIVTVEVNSLGPYFKNYYGHIRHFNLIFFGVFFLLR